MNRPDRSNTATLTRAMPARGFLIGLLLVQVLNLVLAVLITAMALTPGGFGVNLVYSVCVGTLAYTLINGGRILFWGEHNKPPLAPFLLLMLAGVLVGQAGGYALAGWLTGTRDQSRQLLSASPLVLLAVVASAAASWYFWNRGRLALLRAEAQAEKARAAAIEKQAMQAQLQLLQAQIEPHMLFNTLANLQGLIAIDPPQAQTLLDQLILYLRATLSASRAANTTLGSEFALMRAYLGLMQVRMGERLHCELDLPETLAGTVVPPMLLQPLVENAIRHGLEPKLEPGTLSVKASLDQGRLVLEVSDDGQGLQSGSGGACGTAGTGLGLANIRERLQALYGDAASLQLLAHQPQGCRAVLTLPLP